MNYSSAIFKDYNGDLLPDPSHDLESHEEAQLRKMRKILNRLKIQPGDRVLEIGTGWGSLSILAASSFDCTIDTITLSSEQLALATQRVADAGLSHRITLHLMDFRAVRSKPEWQGAFDKFVSIEMMEHVGREFLEEYWRVADWAMKGDKATGVVQVITMPEARIPAYDSNGVDFIQKWIFPGCYIPSLETLISTMNNGTSGRLTVDAVSNIGPHYARTLREWKRRFLRNWEGTIKQLLIEQHSLDEQALGAFKRRWMYYFDYCEAGFSTRTLGDHIITFTREGNVDFGCDVDSLAIDSDWGENVKGTDQRRT
jgi:cyclopropane-fatty-acyl-phospholipid synthase